MESFGKWIKNRRHEKHIGLYRCAGYTGIGGEGLRLIECGKTNPANCKAATLYALALILELDPLDVIRKAIHQDDELVRRLRRSMEWKNQEHEQYFRRYPKYNRLKKFDI